MYYIEICIPRKVAATLALPLLERLSAINVPVQFREQFPYGLQTNIVTEKLESRSKSLLITLFSL